MFSIVTVVSYTRIQSESANAPSVIRLMVSPSALRRMMEVRIESGIDIAMMTVLRQLPRKRRIIMAVRQAAIRASRPTPEMAPRTKTDWSASGLIWRSGGSVFLIVGKRFLILLMMSNVEVVPFFWMVISVDRRPSTRTILVWGGKPSRTKATSWM